ncbi:MAG TPA: helix-hairpin-helix domain-containing protein [Terriglobales bacterium]|nr:helix-hairpin-helix domain-containing protein [Terriglobales bacterium]
MKPALVFLFGAVGLFTLAKYERSASRTRQQALRQESKTRRRARKMRFRHRNQDGLLDLNSATVFELKELRGIGDALAGRIIDNRPYYTKIDLVGRRIIPESAYETIKHMITVTHAA